MVELDGIVAPCIVSTHSSVHVLWVISTVSTLAYYLISPLCVRRAQTLLQSACSMRHGPTTAL